MSHHVRVSHLLMSSCLVLEAYSTAAKCKIVHLQAKKLFFYGQKNATSIV